MNDEEYCISEGEEDFDAPLSQMSSTPSTLRAEARPFVPAVMGAYVRDGHHTVLHDQSSQERARCRECSCLRPLSAYSAQHQKLIERGTHQGVCYDCKREKSERKKGTCAYCGRWRSLTLDHIVPKSAGGKLTPSNCALVCGPCNHAKGADQPEGWMIAVCAESAMLAEMGLPPSTYVNAWCCPFADPQNGYVTR